MNRHLEDVQGKSHPGFGRCIFCGSDGGVDKLRREHILPKALGGKAVIQAASCKDCETITSYVDGYLSRAIFLEYRAHTGGPSRRKKSRPTEFPARLMIDGVEDIRSFPTAEHPYFLALPVWGRPTILTGSLPQTHFAENKAHIYEFIPADLLEKLSLPENTNLQVRGTGEINFSTFARAIAKVAYCNAVMRYGLDGFIKFPLPDVILGKSQFASHFVGCDLTDPPPPAPIGVLHSVDFDLWTSPKDETIIVASVRLFAHSGTDTSGMPIYFVAVGQPITPHKPSDVTAPLRC